MTMTTQPTGSRQREAAFVAQAAACAPVLERHAARHDEEGSWVGESFEQVRDAGLLAIGVPEDLGGEGATIRELAMVQRRAGQSTAPPRWPPRCTSTSPRSPPGATAGRCPVPRRR
ncbi:MAG: acyl-CoA dehydrogenase family protein [Acidimicrobiales bacterium]